MNDRDRINKAIIAYYGMEDAIMSDEEFDTLFIKEYGDEISPFEVYQNIYKGRGRERSLEQKMLSLKKANNKKELQDFISKFYFQGADSIFITPKFDGLSVLIKTDDNGEVISAVTRGNGLVGHDITYAVSCIQQKLPQSSLVEAEICLREEHLLEAEKATGKKYNHVRNAASGIVRMSSNKTAQAARLLELAFHFRNDMYGARTYNLEEYDNEVILKRNGKVCNLEEELYDYKSEYEKIGLLTDGVVIVAQKNNSIMRDLGDNGKQPEYSFAWKFPSSTQIAYLADIIWQQGRTKKTPVAIFEPPVHFGGTKVSRCTLNNQEFIDNLNISPGDTVEVALFNEVIPGVVSVIEKGDGVSRPLGISSSNTTIENIVPFVRNFLEVLDVYGVGEKFYNDYAQHIINSNHSNLKIRPGMIQLFIDICNDPNVLQQFTGMQNKDSKKRKSIHESFIRSRNNVKEPQWLASLGIPFIGVKNATKIIQNKGGLENVLKTLNNNPEELKTNGIGDKTVQSLTQHKDEIIAALAYIPIDRLTQREEDQFFQGTVVITGKLNVSRKEAEKILNINGWELSSSITNHSTALITDNIQGNSRKLKSAKQKEIPIIETTSIEDALEKLSKIRKMFDQSKNNTHYQLISILV